MMLVVVIFDVVKVVFINVVFIFGVIGQEGMMGRFMDCVILFDLCLSFVFVLVYCFLFVVIL